MSGEVSDAARDAVPALIDVVLVSEDRPDAVRGLTDRYGISEAGANAVLDMQVHRFTGVHRQRILADRDEWARRAGCDT